MTTVSWKDNKQVVLASTYVGACPVGNIEQFDKKEKNEDSYHVLKANQGI